MTPECLIMLTGCPRDKSMYPSTERCDERRAKVCSSSTSIGIVVVTADNAGGTLDCDNKDVLAEVVVACVAIYSTRCRDFGDEDVPFVQMSRLNAVSGVSTVLVCCSTALA